MLDAQISPFKVSLQVSSQMLRNCSSLELCYAYIHGQGKLQPRCNKDYFVGDNKESPLYLVYYPKRGSISKHLVKLTEKFTSKEIASLRANHAQL